MYPKVHELATRNAIRPDFFSCRSPGGVTSRSMPQVLITKTLSTPLRHVKLAHSRAWHHPYTSTPRALGVSGFPVLRYMCPVHERKPVSGVVSRHARNPCVAVSSFLAVLAVLAVPAEPVPASGHHDRQPDDQLRVPDGLDHAVAKVVALDGTNRHVARPRISRRREILRRTRARRRRRGAAGPRRQCCRRRPCSPRAPYARRYYSE